jgi:hypothetical protein
MKGIYTYIPETNNVPKEYNVAAILSLLCMVSISLVRVLTLQCTLTLALSEVCAQCPIWQFSVVPWRRDFLVFIIIIIIIMTKMMMVIILIVMVAWTLEPILTLASLDSSSDASPFRLVKCTFRILAATQTNLTDFFGAFPQCHQVNAG